MPQTTTLPEAMHDLDGLISRARKGDQSVMPQIRQWFDANPKVWRFAGDLGQRNETKLVEMMTGPDAMTQEGIARVSKAMAQDLAGEHPSPLEQLLARRIVLDWIYLHYVENIEIQGMERGCPPKEAVYHAKRVDQAHRRYMRSIKMLATVRRLLTPAVLMQVGLHAHKHTHIADGEER